MCADRATTETYRCPLCGVSLMLRARYPDYVCGACAARATSRGGRPLSFFNTHMSGGFAGCYADTQEPYPRHECFIDGLPCYADEARFGGIVIQTTALA